MLKNAIMAALAAVLTIEECPWFQGCTVQEKLGVFLGISIPLFIFFVFLEETAEKWRKYRERCREVERTVERLRKGRTE